MFIPSYILENMARAGIEESKLIIQQSEITRKEREKRPQSIESMLKTGVPAGGEKRYIYMIHRIGGIQWFS
jgi:hypothetical protein